MANQLKMAMIQAIQRLPSLRWSRRRIARELGIDRGTVSRYLQSWPADSKPAISPLGGPPPKPATFAGLPAPSSVESEGNDHAAGERLSNPADQPSVGASPAGNLAVDRSPERAKYNAPLGRPSHCQAYGEIILAKLAQQLSAQRIWQDLVAEHGFPGSYDSVKRFVRRLGHASAPALRRMECAAGEEAQVDFGAGAPVLSADGKRRRTYVFRIVLSHSRKAYSEATLTQTTDDFLRALENAFAHFGGVPKTLVIDNLKAAVAHPDWFDPELTPKVQSFCQHYGTVILPTKPYTPRHKGKVEAGVKYVKNNALKGRVFDSLEAENRFRANWETNVANKRIHGTTKRQVGKVFEEVERGALLPRPIERFAMFHEAQRKVSRDGHVEVAKAYYSVPTEYLARTVWVRWDARLVRIFNRRFEQIALHVRQEPGRFSTLAEHVAAEKISGVERGAAYLLGKVQGIGPQAHQWAEAMLASRGIEGTRVLQGLLSLGKKHTASSLETACEIALSHGAFRLRTLRKLIGRTAAWQQPLPFLDEHPIIRPLEDYAAIVARALHRQADRRGAPESGSLSEGFLRHGSGVRDGMGQSSPDGANHRGCDVRWGAPSIRLSLVGPCFARCPHLCRARLRFTGQFNFSSHCITNPGVLTMQDRLQTTLKQLHLSGLAQNLDVRLQEAAGHGLNHAEFLELVLQDELLVRHERQINRRVKAAQFRELKSLDEFDFAFNPSIPKKQVFDLATCRFVREGRDVLLIGPPGTGKSFLAQAIGDLAIKQNFMVFYRSIFDVVRDFLHDEILGNEDKVLQRYLKPDVLILDDMGMKKLPNRSGEVLFEIIMRRYETRSTLMTSNRPLEDWGKLLADVPSATAILDRFLHHAEILTISGRSYRLRDKAAAPMPDTMPDEHTDEVSKPAISPAGSPSKKRNKTDAPNQETPAAETATTC